MEKQIFLNKINCRFNLRKPKIEEPTNIYLVVSFGGKQTKLTTGVKVHPNHWNAKKQEAYMSLRLTELDNVNNLIVNEKLQELRILFMEFKHYLCEHPDYINQGITILKRYIYKGEMKTPQEQSCSSVMKQMIDAKDGRESTKKQQTSNVCKFERFLSERKIPDTWLSMNLDTFNRYQRFLIDEGRSITTIKNIIKDNLFALLKKADKLLEVPFKWHDSNLDSFEIIKDKSNKELASNKKVALTEEQLVQLYNFEISGTEKQVRKNTEIRDLFVLQCLLGQRIGDMQKFFNGDCEKDEAENTISIVQQKTNARAIIPLLPLAKEIILKYENTELKYYKPDKSALNKTLREIVEKAGLDEPVTFEYDGVKQAKPLYELVHTHTARHTFITIMCRKGIPKDTLIIATGHEDTKMIDEVYSHLNSKDKAAKISKAFKENLMGDIFGMSQEKALINERERFCKVSNNDRIKGKYRDLLKLRYSNAKLDMEKYLKKSDELEHLLKSELGEESKQDCVDAVSRLRDFFITESKKKESNAAQMFDILEEYENQLMGAVDSVEEASKKTT